MPKQITFASMQSHHLTVQRTARYYTLGEPGPQTRYCWLACHGYAQLAGLFIRKFESILDPATLVIAPEGLSRFYWQGMGGSVGASWMTKEDRLAEIDDHCFYLQTLYEKYTAQIPANAKIILAGFSQGCATVLRWMVRCQPRFDHLVLWAGNLPDDIDYQAYRDYFEGKSIHYIYGLSDEYITPERSEQLMGMLRNSGMRVNIHTFDGKHELDRDTLVKWADNFL